MVSGSRLTCLTFFEEEDDVEVEEWDPGDVATFGLILEGSSRVCFGDDCSVFGRFTVDDFDVLLIEAIAARSRSICSCCWRSELRKCSRCIKAAVMADESRLGKRLDEPLLRNTAGSRAPGNRLFGWEAPANSDAYAADKRCRSIIDRVKGSKEPNVGGSGIRGDGGCEELFELSDFILGEVRLREDDDCNGGDEEEEEFLFKRLDDEWCCWEWWEWWCNDGCGERERERFDDDE